MLKDKTTITKAKTEELKRIDLYKNIINNGVKIHQLKRQYNNDSK